MAYWAKVYGAVTVKDARGNETEVVKCIKKHLFSTPNIIRKGNEELMFLISYEGPMSEAMPDALFYLLARMADILDFQMNVENTVLSRYVYLDPETHRLSTRDTRNFSVEAVEERRACKCEATRSKVHLAMTLHLPQDKSTALRAMQNATSLLESHFGTVGYVRNGRDVIYDIVYHGEIVDKSGEFDAIRDAITDAELTRFDVEVEKAEGSCRFTLEDGWHVKWRGFYPEPEDADEQRIARENALMEVTHDISMEAASLILSRRLCVEDSRELAAVVIDAAREFEAWWQKMPWRPDADYMSEVERFARDKIVGYYNER